MDLITFTRGPVRLICPALLLALTLSAAEAGQNASVRSPASGVLCDRYMCANDKGVSRELTSRYLGKKAAARLFSQGEFSQTEFTFANGIFCDVKERLCRENRFYGADGKHSGAISEKYTAQLFGK
ncbi:Fels-1 prophage protein [Trinickia symbiotica]|uniref:Fels-1 Propage domain-containing protein n=1 Tax=Trinickia symbiotica TaxID=863227 RepID=A0A2N7X452_9BURK|nr:YcgJ family protein [Trinickia symbiotica]PMS36397.1 hypothetical protein C0Z20_13055 [Trinickia symbiotica]PPK44784.1 Fels-1 prophage protein [Trinickia symbiotica]